MFTNDKIVTQWDWQKAIKIGIAIIVLLYIVRAIYTIYIANTMMSMTSDIVSTQKAQFKKLDNESQAQIKKVQDGMKNGINEMEQNIKHVDDRMANFAKDFHDSLEAEFAKIRERRRQEYIHRFYNDHFRYYDVGLYGSDRKKAMESTHYQLPDYAQYDALRNKAIQCHIDDHNHYEEVRYKNKIAQLKLEHNEKQIPNVAKPNYWKWPLTKEQLNEIAIHPIPVMDIITLEGKCLGA